MMLTEDPIALGRTAEVYAGQDHHILKLFYDWVPVENVHYEARIARTMNGAGLPVPAPDDVTEINGR